ncbi:MAG: hypothetical protein DRI86_00920 [Bacteroidetes bacterium]|nr:MAG: hypothetical protein DRI86_00920 [Bacteroidota bacterium]
MDIHKSIKDIVSNLKGNYPEDRIKIDIIDKTGLNRDTIDEYFADKKILPCKDTQGDGSIYYIIADLVIIENRSYWNYDDAYGQEHHVPV